MRDKPDSVLFVCTLNSIRSPMAEGLLKARYGREVYVQSCGMEAGELNDLMVAVMREKNIDMQEHKSRSLSDLADTSFDQVVCFTEDAKAAAEAIFGDADTDIILWPTPDPTQGALDVRAMLNNFRAVRDTIEARIERTFG